tara:strand:- start:43807 stop:44148 length:342 start_codon:yes stop_codon:yes gene_type:complete
VTNDVTALKNDYAIKRAVINLVRTRMGERFFQPLIGSRVEDQMFELQSPEMANMIETEIRVLLDNYEPRVAANAVTVTYPLDSNEMNVSINYDIVGLSFPTQTVDFILQPTRV